jgi:hypothetical protein
MPDADTFLSSAAMTKRPKCPVAPVTTIITAPFDRDDRGYNKYTETIIPF